MACRTLGIALAAVKASRVRLHPLATPSLLSSPAARSGCPGLHWDMASALPPRPRPCWEPPPACFPGARPCLPVPGVLCPLLNPPILQPGLPIGPGATGCMVLLSYGACSFLTPVRHLRMWMGWALLGGRRTLIFSRLPCSVHWLRQE